MIMNKHKWNEEIIAWANGDEIECRLIDFNATSNDWGTVYHPQWDNPSIEFRIKPKDEIITIEVGKSYKLRDGRKARVYATDGYNCKQIHGAIYYPDEGWSFAIWDEQGKFHRTCDSQLDIVSEWTEPHPAESWEVDKKILVSVDEERWHKAYFSHFENGLFYTFAYGKTSWTQSVVVGYKYAKPAEEE